MPIRSPLALARWPPPAWPCLPVVAGGGPNTGTAVTAPPADDRFRTLTYDFGAVRPAVRQTHSFQISNPTATAWTFDQVRATCSCTMAGLSAETVPPGGSVEVTFAYSPPAEPTDDRRSIDVLFREPAAPLVRLVVEAKVRHPRTVLPVRLRLDRLPHGKPHVERVTVEDWGGEPQPVPELTANHDWLTVGTPERLEASEPGLTARWAVPLTVAADRLSPGSHAGELTAAAGQPHPEGLRLSVEVEVVPPLDPLPRQLFFGTAAVGKPTTITFAVRLPAGVPADSLTFSHDLGSQLTITPATGKPDRAGFTATLTPATAGVVRGTVGLRCGDPTVPETKLAVTAHAASGP